MMREIKARVSNKNNNKNTSKSNRFSYFSNGTCLLSSAVIFLFLTYGLLTIHLLNRGEISRKKDQLYNRSHLHPHGDLGDLTTHPELQHHDLSSIMLEGLPPLRSVQSRSSKISPKTLSNSQSKIYEETDPTAEYINLDFDDEKYKYLRGEMPIN